MEEKIKPQLTGAAETMLQSFYARAKYSKSKNCKFYDAKAVELAEKIDYNFSDAHKDSAMSNGVVARSIVLDELVGDFYRLVYGQEISEEEMAVMQEIGAKAGVVDEAH